MGLQTIIARYVETKAVLSSPKCISAETTELGGGKRRTVEDAFAFVIDCELAIRDMGKWGVTFRKYFSSYIGGFSAWENQEHKTVDKIAFRAFRKRGLI